jgi:N-acetyl-anhydromuramyl-L-alanine amidase AmpD
LLAAYGYDLSITGLEDEPSQLALRAFQMHFRPANYSGFFDNESTARLISLLERYRPRVLASLDDFPAALHTQQQ